MQILNVCQLYEQGPVVLALFVDAGSCTSVLGEMQALVPEFPGVRFAAVAIRDGRAQIRRLVRSRGLTFPVGLDSDGTVAEHYKSIAAHRWTSRIGVGWCRAGHSCRRRRFRPCAHG